MAIKDKRGLEGMPLKLLIVSLLISLSAPIVLSSMSSFQTKTSVSEAMSAAEQIRETITATYISGPGNHRVLDSPLQDDKCAIEIGGDLNQTESMVISVVYDGGTERIYLADPVGARDDRGRSAVPPDLGHRQAVVRIAFRRMGRDVVVSSS